MSRLCMWKTKGEHACVPAIAGAVPQWFVATRMRISTLVTTSTATASGPSKSQQASACACVQKHCNVGCDCAVAVRPANRHASLQSAWNIIASTSNS